MMSILAKSVVLDIANSWGGTSFLGIRAVDFYLAGSKIAVTSGFTAYATTSIDLANNPPRATFDTSTSKTGTTTATQWFSGSGALTNQRLIIVFDTPLEFDKIVVNNSHLDGTFDTRGARDVKITSSTDAITSTVYNAAISNATVLFADEFRKHVLADVEDEQTVYDANAVPVAGGVIAKSVIIDIADNYTGTYTGIRSVDFYFNDVLVQAAGTYLYAFATTSIDLANNPPVATFDTSLTKTGTMTGTQWLSGSGANKVNQRLIVCFVTPIQFDKIVVNNAHNSGSYTLWGAKNVVIQSSTDRITNTTYNAAIANSTLLFTGVLNQHISSNVEDPQILEISGPAITYTVTYSGNTNDSGSAPVDSASYEEGSTVTILGNTGSLTKSGYTFAGWNTAADGSGTTYAAGGTFAMGAADVTLYAVWAAIATVHIQASLDQHYNMLDARIASPIAQGYHMTGSLDAPAILEQAWSVGGELAAMSLAQAWGLRLGVDVVQPYGDAPTRTSTLFQPYGEVGQLKRALVQRWQDAIPLHVELEQQWHLPGAIVAELSQPWSVLGELASGLLVQGWDLRDFEAVRAILQQSWSLADDGALLRYSLDVYCDGARLGVFLCNIESSRDEDVLSCEIHLARESDYLQCRVGLELQVVVGIGADVEEEYLFRITSPRIEERHGEALYIIEALSPAAYLLGAPWAGGIDAELSGRASEIAVGQAAPLALDWRTVDWHIPLATWIAAGETPLDLLRRLADAVGARVQSLPDGSLVIEPDYPVAVPGWVAGAADGMLVETLDCFSAGDSHDPRPGYNRYLVGDQMTAADGLRLEEEALSAALKEVRGYQIPWDGAFTLTHTGGDWVQIEAMGIEERQETEVIELVGGAGRTRYPIYSRDAVVWQQTNLGSVTVSEDGSVQADIEGQSLLELTYTTRCRRWRVRNPRDEKLQLVAEI